MKPSFSKRLLAWYHLHRRNLPWRQTKDPYRILLSEVMLQQTQVVTVIPYYKRFLTAFPDWKQLAQAPINQVLKLWEGLGYYSRARNLHRLAAAVVDLHDARLPSTYDSLIALPGIGRYTAGAVLSIAFGKDFPVVDGNVQRVLTRFFAIGKNVRLPETQRTLWTLAEALLPSGDAGHYNQALMELGAMVCLPSHPKCLICPVARDCQARQLGRQMDFPVKSKKLPVPHKQVAAAVIWRGDKILISQRPFNGLLGGLWEFPGGKQEAGETLEQTTEREILEELGVKISAGRKMALINHAYTHFKITLHVFECRYLSGEPQAIGVRAWKWVYPKELLKFAFPAANQPVIEMLTGRNDRKKIKGSRQHLPDQRVVT